MRHIQSTQQQQFKSTAQRIRAGTAQQSTNASLNQLPTHHTVPECCSLHLRSRAFLYKDLRHAMMMLIMSLSPDEDLYSEMLPQWLWLKYLK